MSEFIPLSVPNFGAREAELAGQAITSGWVSTSGGKVTEFEEALAAYVGMPRAVACNAGTSASSNSVTLPPLVETHPDVMACPASSASRTPKFGTERGINPDITMPP